jgi:hypothetical protein
LQSNRAQLDALALRLLEREVLCGAELKALLGEIATQDCSQPEPGTPSVCC